MRVVRTGATGLIGRPLGAALAARGDQVVALVRSASSAARLQGETAEAHVWAEPKRTRPPAVALDGADAVVHLLGEPVAQRWTAKAKEEIRESRVLSTRSLVAGLSELPDGRRPRTLVSGSATGYYGLRVDEPVEEGAPPGTGFLAELVMDWEREALAAAELPGTRVALIRTGVVLSRRGGALAQMLPPFRLGLGGPVAGGRQYVSWIHLRDAVGAILRCLDDARCKGPLNVTAPNPVTNAELSQTLGRILRRPAVLPIPALALRVLYGEMSSVVTGGQRAIPRRLHELGHEFAYPELEPALRDLLTEI